MDDHMRRADAERAAKAKIGFFIHLAVFLIVNAGLAALNLAAQPEKLWFVWVLFGWGLGIILHAVLVFVAPKGSRLKEWMIKREMNSHRRSS